MPKPRRKKRQPVDPRLGSRLRAVREAKGLERDDVAKRARMHPLRLWRLESGRQRVALEDLEKLAPVLSSSVSEIYSDEAAAP